MSDLPLFSADYGISEKFASNLSKPMLFTEIKEKFSSISGEWDDF
jgi:hypothetical protein